MQCHSRYDIGYSVHDCGVVILVSDFQSYFWHEVVDYSQSFVFETLSPLLLQSSVQFICASEFI